MLKNLLAVVLVAAAPVLQAQVRVIESSPQSIRSGVAQSDLPASAESRAVLLAHADKLKGASVAVRLEGHADERGSREYNMALGEKRANAVRDFLVTQGVNGSSLEVVSFGEEQPAATGSDEASWSQNRRVEVKY